jgi:hypothetical protein
MPGLSDSVTIGIVISLVFGALFFYLYSRLAQNEKRVSLIENILLDLKMSADSGWGASAAAEGHQQEGRDEMLTVDHVEPISSPQPLDGEDVDSNEEEMYQQLLASTGTSNADDVKTVELSSSKPLGSIKQVQQHPQVQVTKVQANYSAMTVKELKTLAKSRGLTVPSGAGRKELTDSLRKLDGGDGPASVEAGSPLGTMEGSSLEDVETL